MEEGSGRGDQQVTYVFDLDHTICTPNNQYKDTQRRYVEAEPIVEMIDLIRLVKDRGIRVVIYTARRMLTHNGDLKAIEEDVGSVTRTWLATHGVPYDELRFGKPYGDLYIDDKACLPEDLRRRIRD